MNKIIRNKRSKSMMALAVAFLLSLSTVAPVMAEAATEVKPVNDPYRVGELKAAEDADQLILVIGGETPEVTVSYYKKEATTVKKGPGEAGQAGSTWTEVFTTDGVYGKNGATARKKEGDGKTPTGTYSFTMAFGIKESPGSILPYHQIQKGDYWVDDSDSTYYNKLVNINQTKKTWNSAENMAASVPFYNYGLVLDYNKECVPGAGSAIFIHCTKTEADSGSQGCIRIPEELMKQLVQSVTEKTKIIIVTDVNQLEYAKK